jgi:hypothetical protein
MLTIIQQINGSNQERHGGDLAASIAVRLLADKRIQAQFEQAMSRRQAFIAGNGEWATVIMDCLFLANLDQFYRTGQGNTASILYVTENDFHDLQRLAHATTEHAGLFRVEEELVCNPRFGDAITRLVDGADGDLIIDGMLIDIKTESEFKWKIGHLRQLIGYWVLSCLTPSFKPTINRLGIWNPRYCRLVYIDVKQICRDVDMIAFVGRFLDIIGDADFAESTHLPSQTKSELVSEVNRLWNSSEQPLRNYYT